MVAAAPGKEGVPMHALSDVLALFPKDSFLSPGIAHHYQYAYDGRAHLAIVSKEGSAAWEKEIAERIACFEPQTRWWLGTDAGCSSAAIFTVFCRNDLKWASDRMARSSVPRDMADFGRCQRLLNLFPEWKARLKEVADRYPKTAWPELIDRWADLETLGAIPAGALLRSIINKEP